VSSLKDVAKELAEAGFFAKFNEASKSEEVIQPNEYALYAQKTGILSAEQLRYQIKAQNFEADLDKIWAFFNRYGDKGYYSIKKLSYSFLKHVDNIRYPEKSYWFGDSTLRFEKGKAFEDILTGKFDRELFSLLSNEDILEVQKWVSRAYACPEIMEAVDNYEQQFVANGIFEGYKVKGKLDFYKPATQHALDTKTTKHKTQRNFYKQCVDMGYFVQGVLYMQIAPAQRYTIVGTSKVSLANFLVEMGEAEIKIGQEQLALLLENLEYYGIQQYFEA
jgi:hypothetical protein